MTIPTEDFDDPEHASLVRRVRDVAIGAAIVLSLLSWWWLGLTPALALMVCAVIMIMNFLWLERIVGSTLRAEAEPQSAWVGLRILVRFGLIVVSIGVVVAVARYHPASVLLGFSVIVIGLLAEGARALHLSLTHDEVGGAKGESERE